MEWAVEGEGEPEGRLEAQEEADSDSALVVDEVATHHSVDPGINSKVDRL